MYYYSKSTGSFYSSSIHSSFPEDAIELTKENYTLLVEGRGQGKRIVVDSKGQPKLADPLPPTNDQVMAMYELAIQEHLDLKAKQAGYDNIQTAVTYAEEPAVVKFQNDGKAFRKWRSLVWGYTYEQLNLVLSGQRDVPSVEEFVLELPKMETLS